jgi:hypothetical protein
MNEESPLLPYSEEHQYLGAAYGEQWPKEDYAPIEPLKG